jgi:uncharacterized Zn-binding protein involved in type VI secretion
MPPAARLGDISSHGGAIVGPGAPNVLVAGLPAAALGDTHVCPVPPHGPTPIVSGSATVLINGRLAAWFGSTTGCGALIVDGAPTVEIGA